MDFMFYFFNLSIYASVRRVLTKLLLVYSNTSIFDRKKTLISFFMSFGKHCPFLSPNESEIYFVNLPYHYQIHLVFIAIRLILEKLSTI